MAGNLIKLRFTLNGEETTLQCPPGIRLIDVLREYFGLTETREGCGAGECGHCLVLKDGQVVNACLIPAFALADAEIVTAEGIRRLKSFTELRRSLPAEKLFSCRLCASGSVVALAGQLLNNPEGGEREIRDALEGVLCSCGGYAGVLEEALHRLSRRRRYGRR